MKQWKLLIVALLTTLLFASPVMAKTYRMALTPWGGFEPYVVADKKGFFKEEGIDVKVNMYTSIEDWFKGIVSKRFDFKGAWNSTMMSVILDMKKPNVFLGGMSHEKGDTGFIVRKGTKPSDLKGKTIGLTGEVFGFKYLVMKYLQDNGMKYSDVKIRTDLEDRLIKQLEKGKIAGVVLGGGFVDKAINKANGEVVASSDEYYQAMVLGMTMPTDKFKQMPKGDLKKFWRAVIRGLYWMNAPENKEEMVKMVYESYKGSPAMAGNFTSLAKYKKYQEKVYFFNSKEEHLSFLQTKFEPIFHDLIKGRKTVGLHQDPPYSQLFNTKALEAALKEM